MKGTPPMDGLFPLIGRSNEVERLASALRKRESLLLIGPAGSGKTALIRTAIRRIPATGEILYLRYSANLHHLLVDLARCLLAIRHKSFQNMAHVSSEAEKWLSHQTSVHLKGLLWSALEAEPGIVILDGIDGASFPIYRFLQRLYFAPGMAIFAATKDVRSLGALSRLFWDPRRELQLRPLQHVDAERLFDLAVNQFGLEHLDIGEFKEKVLESAHGNPGEIIEMCRLASNPMYVSGRHIKFVPLRMDVLMRFL
jgi:energy-coupling factor transporter ATP-binding protein EcfA2